MKFSHASLNDASMYNRLEGVQVSTATPSTKFVDNVKYNSAKGYKSIATYEGFGRIKGQNNPIALVGGGPSIKKELDKIKEFQASGFPVVACGSSHDYLVDNGIIPDICTICDPDPISAAYAKRHNEKTAYFLALSCDPLLFEVLRDRKIYVWNCRSDEAAPSIQQEIIGHVDILGGCTVGLRSIAIAMCFGYSNVHIWGFDSCMGSGDEHHAYEFETDQEEVGEVYPVRFGDHRENTPDANGKYYICSGYQLAQAMHFQQFLIQFGGNFIPTFHGEGMLADYVEYLRRKAQEAAEASRKQATIVTEKAA